MEGVEDSSQKDVLHDYIKEKFFVMIIGAYTYIRKPLPLFILNVMFLTCDSLLCSFMVVMILISFFVTEANKTAYLHLSQTLILFMGTISVRLVNYYTNDTLKLSRKIIRNGVFQYCDADIRIDTIKRKSVEQIRFIISIYTRMILATYILVCFILPLLKYCFLKPEPSNAINPYLPQPIYMPFNTNNAVGFVIAFMANAVCCGTLFTTFICHAAATVSCALQLTAQIDVLTFSLKNIENRAQIKLSNIKPQFKSCAAGTLYGNADFQRCLYLCLRENIQHHHALLR